MTDEQPITEEKKPTSSPLSGVKIALFTAMLFILLAFIAIGFIYSKLMPCISDVQNQLARTADAITLLKSSLTDVQQKQQQNSDDTKQLRAEWNVMQKNDVSKWHLAEAQYLVRLANDRLQFAHNVTLALVLLKRADQVLATDNTANILEIRKALAADMARISALPTINVTSLYLQLVSLNAALDQLPLPTQPLKPENSSTPIVNTANLPWWQAAWQHTLAALSKIVVVRYNQTTTLPLVMPDEKMFLYQNVHAQIENASWALLHRNHIVYQASLQRALTWIQQYFAPDAAETKRVLQQLQALLSVNILPPTVDITATQVLIDQAAS